MNLWSRIAIIAVGGAVGALGRTGLTALVAMISGLGATGKILGTLVVNLCGCFGMGLAKGAVEMHGWGTAELNAFVFSGMLGAFTTFSTFEENTVRLWRNGNEALAGGYLGVSVVGGVLAFLAGWLVMKA